MGQCAGIPSHYPFEEDISIMTLTRETNSFRAFPMWYMSSSINGNNSKHSFLTTHKPDRKEKCLLDPAQVDETMRVQATTLMLRDDSIASYQDNQFSPSHEENEDSDGSRVGAASIHTGFASEFTTNSSATRPVANLSAPLRKVKESRFSVLENLDNGHQGISSIVDESDDDESIDLNPELQRLTNDIKKELTYARQTLKMMREEHLKPEISKELCVAKNEAFYPSLGLSGPILACRHPREDIEVKKVNCPPACSCPTVEEELRTEEFMSVLYLTMKANLFQYYRNQFLPMFPDLPHAPGLSELANEESYDMRVVESDSDSTDSEKHEWFGDNLQLSPIRLLSNDDFFLDLAITGSLGLVPRHVRARRFLLRPNQKSPDHYLVLINRRSGVPLAVCALKATSGLPVVRLYATKQRVPGQRPAASTTQLGLDWCDFLPLYTWAEIVTEGEFPGPVSYYIYMASGSDGCFSSVPSFRASFLASGCPDFKVVGRTDKERYEAGCALISLRIKEANRDPCFHLEVAKGLDPALFICLTAVIDELFEKAMRIQCRSQRQRQRQCRQNHERMPVQSQWQPLE